MLQEIKISKIYRSEKDKDGKPLITKDGRHYGRISIQDETQYHNQWISGFQNQENNQWKVNDIVRVNIEVKDKGDGNVYLNFKTLDRVDLLELRIEALEKANREKSAIKEKAESEFAEEELVNGEDLPF